MARLSPRGEKNACGVLAKLFTPKGGALNSKKSVKPSNEFL